jgi:hypothetical protein
VVPNVSLGLAGEPVASRGCVRGLQCSFSADGNPGQGLRQTAAKADANAARAELDALDAPAEVPAREQVEQALAVLGDQVEDVLSDDRSPELLHEFYASMGLSLTWDHSARRLTAELDLAPAVADLMGQAEPLIHRGGKHCVRGGT